MLDKDKLILVCYVGFENISRPKAITLLQEIKTMLENKFDDSVKILVIPQVHSNETKIEFINTNNETLDEDKLLRLETVMQSFQANINKYLNFE